MARPDTNQRLSYNDEPKVQARVSALPQQTERKEARPSVAVPSETINQCQQYRYQPRIGQREIRNPEIVKIRLRGHRLSILPANTTDPESLRKEAVHFDKEVSYWERLGYFEMLTSSRGRFVVQYDKTDTDETGIPKAVIGVTEEIIALDSEEDEDDRERMQAIEETEGEIDSAGPTAKRHRTSAVSLAKIPSSTTPTTTKANITKFGTTMCNPGHVTDYRYPEDSDNEDSDNPGDTDEDDDEPPDWTEYENLDITAEKKKVANDSEVEMLDMRVVFVKIDLVPPEMYEAVYELDKDPPGFCDYLVRDQALPELGDLTPMDIIRGWKKEDSEAMTAKWKGGSIRHDGKGFSAVL